MINGKKKRYHTYGSVEDTAQPLISHLPLYLTVACLQELAVFGNLSQ